MIEVLTVLLFCTTVGLGVATWYLWKKVEFEEEQKQERGMEFVTTIPVNKDIENAVADWTHQKIRNEYIIKGDRQPVIKNIDMNPDYWVVRYEIEEAKDQ